MIVHSHCPHPLQTIPIIMSTRSFVSRNNFKLFQIPVCTSRRAECKERAVTASQERGLLSLKQRGRQPIRLTEMYSCCGAHVKLPALTYTCTDLHISHPGIYNSNLVARQGQTVAKRVHHSAPIYGILHGDLTQLQNLIKLKIHKINISNQIVRMYYSVN